MAIHNINTHLLRLTSLLPFESLNSLLIRLSKCNYYESLSEIQSIFHTIINIYNIIDKIDFPEHPETYKILSGMANLHVEQLYAATAHRFASILVPPGYPQTTLHLPDHCTLPLLPQNISSKQIVSSTACRFCPCCLKEKGYHRLTWSPVAVALCLHHRSILIDRCPACHRTLSVEAVVATKCGYCGTDLTTVPSIFVGEDLFGIHSQRIIQAWLGLVTMPYSYPDIFRKHSPSVLYRLADGLRSCIARMDLDWMYLHRPELISDVGLPRHSGDKLTCLQSYCLYTTAFKAIMEWPDSFYDFLQAYRARKNTKRGAGIYSDLGIVFSEWLEQRWQRSEYQFVQDAFHRFLVLEYAGTSIVMSGRYQNNPNLIQQFVYITYTDAARLLRTSTRTIKRMVENGRLVACPPDQKPSNRYKLVRQAEVLELRRMWQDGLSLEESAAWLGISKEVAIALQKVGVLVAERGPSIDGNRCWKFSRSSLDNCLGQIARHIRQIPTLQDVVDLPTAARMVAVIGSNSAGILKQVADGKLPAYCQGQMLGLDALVFIKSDISKYVAELKGKQGWICREEIAQMLGVKVLIISRWIDGGLLSPVTVCGNTYYFDRSEVEMFIANHIFSEEAAAILEVGQLTVQAWTRNGRLKPVSGPEIDGCHRYLFRRMDIEQLCPRQRLTASQMAQYLGVSRARINVWVKQGKVRPLSGPGIDGSKHYLFLLPAQESSLSK